MELFGLDQAPHHSLSIRCLSDGLAFCIRSLGMAELGQLIRRGFLPLDRQEGMSWLEALQGLFYAHDFLSYPYAQVRCHLLPQESVLVPVDLVKAGQEKLWLTAGLEADELKAVDEELHFLSSPLSREAKSLVFSLPRPLYQFLRRTYLVPEILPAGLTVLDGHLRSGQGSPSKDFLVVLEDGALLLLVLWRGEVIAYKSHRLQALTGQQAQAEEGLFYIFSLWRALELDGGRDRLWIYTWEKETAPSSYSAEGLAEILEHLLAPHVATIQRASYSPC